MEPQRDAVLVVDDDPGNRTFLRHFLESERFEVTDAADGAQALSLLDRYDFDLVLLDIVMPGLSGLEVLQQIRASPQHRDLPVIMVTARDQSDDIVRAFDLHADDYVPRPLNYRVLLARIQTQLTLRRRTIALEKANQEMSSDLRAAARVQKALLPRERPKLAGASFDWCFEPCEELAGDLLNLVPLGDGHVALYIFDVSGHGVAAALLAVMVHRALMRMILPIGGAASTPAPAEVAERLNAEFRWDRLGTEQFLTLVYGVLDLERRRFRFVCGGHPGPIVLPRGGEANPVRVEAGSIIGLSEEPYVEQVLSLQPGDRLYLYSDGLTDPRNGAPRKFDEQHLCQVLSEQRGLPLSEGLRSLREAVRVWCAPAKPKDDISVVAVELT